MSSHHNTQIGAHLNVRVDLDRPTEGATLTLETLGFWAQQELTEEETRKLIETLLQPYMQSRELRERTRLPWTW